MRVNIMNMEEYDEQVMDYLEYLGYPEYIATFEPEAVAMSIHKCELVCYFLGVTYRMCALTIFGATFHYQLMREDVVKH